MHYNSHIDVALHPVARMNVRLHIYTDWSKETTQVGCAVISDNHSDIMRIPDGSSIFTAGTKSVDLTLDLLEPVMMKIS